jgi:hypothetical protein
MDRAGALMEALGPERRAKVIDPQRQSFVREELVSKQHTMSKLAESYVLNVKRNMIRSLMLLDAGDRRRSREVAEWSMLAVHREGYV